MEQTRNTLYDVQATAERLGIAVSTLYDMARQRKIPHRRIGVGRGRLMFTEEDIREYLDSCKVEAD